MTNPKAPYLAIRNWEKFQAPSKNGQPLPWCKLYSAQADDFEYQRLTSFQRGVLHDAYIVVTRTARALHNDITWLARTMHTLGTDRPHLQHAIDTLVSRGFLTPTEASSVIWRGEEIEREKEKKKEKRGKGADKPSESGSVSKPEPEPQSGDGDLPEGCPPPSAGHRWAESETGWEEVAI